MSTAKDVSACLINLSHEKGTPVSNLKLQKLVYYSQAWYLAIFKKPLFVEDIEAWVHGPVVPQIFRLYRDYKWSPLPQAGNAAVSTKVRKHLEEVWNAYGNRSAYDLERLTHSEDPWKEARIGLSPDESSHNVIEKDSMRKYYSSRLHA